MNTDEARSMFRLDGRGATRDGAPATGGNAHSHARLRAARAERRAASSGAGSRRAVGLLLLLVVLVVSACMTVSRQDEIQMGRDYSEQLNDELPLIESEAIRGPIRRLGHDLARVSPRPDLPYEFQVVNTNVINAFAVPGGFIYMNRGLISESEDMAEVAGVMAHEVSHVVARHSAAQIERANRAGLGLAIGSILLGQPEGFAALGVNVAANLYFAQHSRADEAEADSLAVGLMVQSGWHPCGLVDFFRTMLRARGDKPGALQALFTSHPLTENRIREVDALVAGLPPRELAGLRRNSPDYDDMKAALADYPPPPKKFRVDEDREPGDAEGEAERDAAAAVETSACPAR